MEETRYGAESPHLLTAREALELFRRKALSPVELTRDCLSRIERVNPHLNAFCHVDAEGALQAARESEQRWFEGRPCGALDGIPSTIKDLALTRGMPTYNGSATSPDTPDDVDAPAVARLRESGAVLLGKTISPEFGWKGVTDNPRHGITRNPWNPALTPGGSSGGAAVAAALNLGLLHQGGDAGGSIRIPGSFTGVFGFKSTYGWVPHWPASAMTTLSHIGPLSRTVSDSALMMRVITRPDARDAYTGPPCSIAWQKRPPLDLRGWRIAYSRNLGYVSVATDIAHRVDEAIIRLRELGAQVDEVDPGFENPHDIFNTLWFAGASKLLYPLDETQRDKLDPGFRAIAEQGCNLSLAEYFKARERRAALIAHMNHFHQRYDLLVTPMMPIAPFAVGHNVPPQGPYQDWTDWTPFSYPFNLTQQPAATLPCGLDDQGLPVGLQLVGPKFQDDRVIAAASLLEPLMPRLAAPMP